MSELFLHGLTEEDLFDIVAADIEAEIKLNPDEQEILTTIRQEEKNMSEFLNRPITDEEYHDLIESIEGAAEVRDKLNETSVAIFKKTKNKGIGKILQ